MQLKYEYEGYSRMIQIIKCLAIIAIIECIFALILFIVIIKDFLLSEFIELWVEFIKMAGQVIALICPVVIIANKLSKIEHDKIIKNGKKYSGYIISCYKTRHRFDRSLLLRHLWQMGVLEVEIAPYKIKRVENIANNDAFKFLQQSFKENSKLRIPIDIYIDDTGYKEKIYADLKNLQLEK